MNNLHADRMRDQEWSERQDRIAQWKEETMSMSKTTTTTTDTTEQVRHTPGPWRVGGGDGTAIFPGKAVAPCIADCGGYSYNDERIGEAQANARLIAAAPELLEACKMLLRWCELENQDDPDIEELTLQTVHEHVEAAIARAEGGAS